MPPWTIARRPGHRPRRLDGAQEAHLVALVCGDPPAGRERWTLRLLADRLVALEIAESVSYQTVRRTLKKMSLQPWRTERWCIPAQGSGDFVAQMEESSMSTSGPMIPGAR